MQIETFEKRATEYIKKYPDYFTDMGFPNDRCKYIYFDYHMFYGIKSDNKMYEIQISQFEDEFRDYPLVQVTGNSWDECVEKALRVLKAYGPKPTRGRGSDDDEDTEPTLPVEDSLVGGSTTFTL